VKSRLRNHRRGISAASTTLVLALVTFAAPIPAASAANAAAWSASTTGVIAAYTIVVPTSVSKSRLQARAVIATGTPCPTLNVVSQSSSNAVAGRASAASSKRSIAMQMRTPGSTTDAAFSSIRACQANLPSGVASATVGKTSLPANLPAKIGKIAILGDTGCRIKGSAVQDCASTVAWPLAQVSRSIANNKPDVTLFVGDFHYRESSCPSDLSGQCGGSPEPISGLPFKDTSYSWLADTFLPMASLLSAAPILAGRGNHEACDRGGNGYSLLFEIRANAAACAPTASGDAPKTIDPTWAVDLPITSSRTLRTVVLDSATQPSSGDSELTSWAAVQRPFYRAAQTLSAKKSGRESWLLEHRPLFGIEAVAAGTPSSWESVDQTAAADGLTGNFNLLITGHAHLAEVAQIPGQPAQMIFGNGGTKLDEGEIKLPSQGPLRDSSGQPLSPLYPAYPNATYLWGKLKFGYAIATPLTGAGQWRFSLNDASGRRYETCFAAAKNVRCK